MPSPDTTSTQGILAHVGQPRFELSRQRPAPELADYVERHWVVRWNLAPGTAFTQELLPHPCVNLVTETGAVAVHGIPLGRSQHRLEGTGLAVGTKFRPGAFAALTRRPARRLVGRSLALPTLFGEAGAQLERRLLDLVHDPDACFTALESFLRRRLPPPDRRFELLRQVVADMLSSGHSTPVAELARRHAVSERTLQRLFGHYIGVPPKWVLRRYRVHEAAERLAAGEAVDAARLAAELGYSDQPHFIRDFTAQVGCAPGAFARACEAARMPAGYERRRAA